MKKRETDEFDTEFVDIDQLIGMYIDEFRTAKRSVNKKVMK